MNKIQYREQAPVRRPTSESQALDNLAWSVTYLADRLGDAIIVAAKMIADTQQPPRQHGAQDV